MLLKNSIRNGETLLENIILRKIISSLKSDWFFEREEWGLIKNIEKLHAPVPTFTGSSKEKNYKNLALAIYFLSGENGRRSLIVRIENLTFKEPKNKGYLTFIIGFTCSNLWKTNLKEQGRKWKMLLCFIRKIKCLFIENVRNVQGTKNKGNPKLNYRYLRF